MRVGAVFDLDETLVDRRGSLDRYASQLLEHFRTRTTLDRASFLSIFHQLDGNGRIPRTEFFGRLSTNAFEKVSPEEIAAHFKEYAWQSPILFEGVTDFIQELRSDGIAIGIVTNGGSHSQNSKIRNSGLDQCVDEFVISEEFGAKKPDSSIYLEIASRLQIAVSRSWFVGDDPVSDVVGPSKVGFNTAWIKRYLPWPEDQDRCYRLEISHVSELGENIDRDA